MSVIIFIIIYYVVAIVYNTIVLFSVPYATTMANKYEYSGCTHYAARLK